MKLNVLGVIPARGGSKSIHRKNLVQLAGRPLIDYAIKAANESRCLTRTILSTEDEEIRKVAKLCGGDVPFIRPFDLATDEAPSVAVAQHALEYMEKEDRRTYDLMCLLQPTAPLRTSEDIDSAITMLINSDADSVISLTQVTEPHPAKMICLSDGLRDPISARGVERAQSQTRPRAGLLSQWLGLLCSQKRVDEWLALGPGDSRICDATRDISQY